MNTVQNLHEIQTNFSVIADLHQNERLRISRDHFVKESSPISVQDHQLFILAAIQNVINGIRKIVQAFGRKWTHQSTDKNIGKIEDIVNRSFQTLHEDLEGIPENRVHQILNELHQIEKYASQSISEDGGLQHYKTTSATGSACLKTPKQEERDLRREKLNRLIIRVDELKAELETVIDRISGDADFLERDDQTVHEIIDGIFEGRSVNEQYVLKETVQNSLSEIFGDDYVRTTMETYGYLSEEILSTKDIHAIMIGLVANLNMNDLEGIYEQRDNPILHLNLDHLPENLDDCTQENIHEVLLQLRSIDRSRFELFKPEIKGPFSDQLERDLGILTFIENLPEYERHQEDNILRINHVKHFGYSEYLSRDVVYGLCFSAKTQFREAALIPLLDEKMEMRYLEAHSLHHGEGLFGVTFLPTEQNPGEPIPVQVVFRGTYDKDSLKRDFSIREKEYFFGFEGPGVKSFNRKRDQMVQKLEEHLDLMSELNDGAEFSLDFMGHSLGASDAQRMMHAVTKRIIETESDDVREMKFHSFNSPAVEGNISSEFVILATLLEDTEFSLRYFDTHRDWVQSVGGARLGYIDNYADIPDNLKLTVMTFSRAPKLLDELQNNLIERGMHPKYLRTTFNGLFLELMRRVDAHTRHLFWTHDDEKGKMYNGTHVAEIRTNNPEDSNLRYGTNLEHQAEELELKTILKELRGFGKNLKHQFQKTKKKFGCASS